MTSPLLEVRDLRVVFRRRRTQVVAADGLTFTVQPGETVGVVGESGSGKSTLGRAILGLVPVQSGSIRFQGHDLIGAPPAQRRTLSRELQAVFQDPYSSLNPTQTIGRILAEPLRAHGVRAQDELRERAAAMLDRVGLPAAALDRYPRQFSGGQRQRIAIARALVLDPRLVICDEALSALDISLQAQIVNMLMDLQRDLGLAYVFIAHDLSIVRLLAQRTIVMQRGRIVEQGPTAQLYADPQHPYTQALLTAEPSPDPAEQRRRRAARRAGTAVVRP